MKVLDLLIKHLEKVIIPRLESLNNPTKAGRFTVTHVPDDVLKLICQEGISDFGSFNNKPIPILIAQEGNSNQAGKSNQPKTGTCSIEFLCNIRNYHEYPWVALCSEASAITNTTTTTSNIISMDLRSLTREAIESVVGADVEGYLTIVDKRIQEASPNRKHFNPELTAESIYWKIVTGLCSIPESADSGEKRRVCWAILGAVAGDDTCSLIEQLAKLSSQTSIHGLFEELSSTAQEIGKVELGAALSSCGEYIEEKALTGEAWMASPIHFFSAEKYDEVKKEQWRAVITAADLLEILGTSILRITFGIR